MLTIELENHCSYLLNTSGVLRLPKIRPVPHYQGVWLYGALCITVLTICNIVCIVLLPLVKKSVYGRLLDILVGLGLGCTTGALFFQVLVEAFDVPLDDEKFYLQKTIVVVNGLYLLFAVHCIARLVMTAKKACMKSKANKALAIPMSAQGSPRNDSFDASDSDSDEGSSELQCSASHGETAVRSAPSRRHHFVRLIAKLSWIDIAKESVETIVDCVTVGAFFALDTSSGVTVFLAILLEDLPHLLGDSGIVLLEDDSTKLAVMTSVILILPGYVGLTIGIVLVRHLADPPIAYLSAFSGGMFIYGIFCSWLPELRTELDEACENGFLYAAGLFGLRTFGFLSGLIITYLMAYYEDDLPF